MQRTMSCPTILRSSFTHIFTCDTRARSGSCLRPYPKYSRANSYPWSPFHPEAGPSRTRSSHMRFRVPASGFRFPLSGFQVPSSGFGFPGSGFQVPFLFGVSDLFRVPGSGCAPGSGFRVPGFGSRVAGLLRFRVLGFGVAPVSGFRVEGPSRSYPCP